MGDWKIVLRKTGRTWGVWGLVSGKKDELIEGGFTSRRVAAISRDEWIRETTKDEVERAERACGWDSHR